VSSFQKTTRRHISPDVCPSVTIRSVYSLRRGESLARNTKRKTGASGAFDQRRRKKSRKSMFILADVFMITSLEAIPSMKQE